MKIEPSDKNNTPKNRERNIHTIIIVQKKFFLSWMYWEIRFHLNKLLFLCTFFDLKTKQNKTKVMSNIHPIIFTLVWPSVSGWLYACWQNDIKKKWESSIFLFGIFFYLHDISVCWWVIQMNMYRRECNSFKIMSFYFNLVLHNFKSFWNVTVISQTLLCDALIFQ